MPTYIKMPIWVSFWTPECKQRNPRWRKGRATSRDERESNVYNSCSFENCSETIFEKAHWLYDERLKQVPVWMPPVESKKWHNKSPSWTCLSFWWKPLVEMHTYIFFLSLYIYKYMCFCLLQNSIQLLVDIWFWAFSSLQMQYVPSLTCPLVRFSTAGKEVL